jgi:hypothetical protein
MNTTMERVLAVLLFISLIFSGFFASIGTAIAQDESTEDVVVYMLGRDDCGFCQKQH